MMDVRESSDGVRTACASDVRGVTLGGLRTGNTKSGILLQAGTDGQDSSEVAAEVKGGVVTFYEVTSQISWNDWGRSVFRGKRN
jgi:hypothetical protein